MKKGTALLLIILVMLFLTPAITDHAHAKDGYRGGGGGHGGSRDGGYRHGGRSHHHGGHWSGGVWIGPAFGWYGWGPWWDARYPYPYYRYPPVVIERQQPLYIEPEPEQQDQGYWYYCRERQAYYPYVEQCPGGWMKVVPSPVPPDVKE